MKRRKTTISILVVFFFTTFVGVVLAEEYSALVYVTRTHNVSSNRPAAPHHEGKTRVYFDAIEWGTSCSCRNTAADLLDSETRLHKELLTGIVMGRQIKIFVDDSIELSGDVCQITLIEVIW